MKKGSTLNALKQSFTDIIPKNDKRTRLSHLNFVSGLIFCFLGDTKSFSIESIRRFMIGTFETPISKSSFWERLSRKRLKNLLHDLIAELMKQLPSLTVMGRDLLTQLQVSSIYLIDSSSMTLYDGAKKSYPGTRTFAGIKWHACFNLLSGKLEWLSTTPTSVHDRKCFPDIKSLVGKLIIFDLGYWDYSLLAEIHAVKGFFLSRVKRNATFLIVEVVKGIGKQQINKPFSVLKHKRKRGKYIEFIGEISHQGESNQYRVIGCWNTVNKQYHWYITNLSVSAVVIYSLYRVRWQIELIFKGCKQSFNLDKRVTSNNDNIIESLILSSIAASFATQVVLKEGAESLTIREKLSISFQRASYVVVLLARDFISYLTSLNPIDTLVRKIKLFSCELYEKNHKRRATSLQSLNDELACA